MSPLLWTPRVAGETLRETDSPLGLPAHVCTHLTGSSSDSCSSLAPLWLSLNTSDTHSHEYTHSHTHTHIHSHTCVFRVYILTNSHVGSYIHTLSHIHAHIHTFVCFHTHQHSQSYTRTIHALTDTQSLTQSSYSLSHKPLYELLYPLTPTPEP